MANYGYTRFVTALDGTSANSAVRTSNSIWVGDAELITVSYTTAADVVSVLSVDASINDGFNSTLTTAAANNIDWKRWASVTTNPGMSNVSAGPRWMRFVRAATDSQASVVVALSIY